MAEKKGPDVVDFRLPVNAGMNVDGFAEKVPVMDTENFVMLPDGSGIGPREGFEIRRNDGVGYGSDNKLIYVVTNPPDIDYGDMLVIVNTNNDRNFNEHTEVVRTSNTVDAQNPDAMPMLPVTVGNLITSYNFQSYTVGSTTVSDLMQAYILNMNDKTVTAHCFRTDFTTLTDKTAPVAGTSPYGWALGMASPTVIYMIHRAKSSGGTANAGPIEVNFYDLSDVKSEGGAYSAGATDMTDVIAHEPYASVSIDEVSGFGSTVKDFQVFPWNATTMLILDTVKNSRADWRIHEVALADATVTTHTGIWSAGSAALSSTKPSYITRDGLNMVVGYSMSGTFHDIVDLSTWNDVTHEEIVDVAIQLKDGNYWGYNTSFGGEFLYDSALTNRQDYTGDISSITAYTERIARVYTENGFFAVDSDTIQKTTFGTTFPDATRVAWAKTSLSYFLPVDHDYGLGYSAAKRSFNLYSLSDGTVHPDVAEWYEVDADVPTTATTDAYKTYGNWGALDSGNRPGPAGSSEWGSTQGIMDLLNLRYMIDAGLFDEE